jgi:plasmid stabilization system protein ParE
MAQVLITPQAHADVERAIAALELPVDTWPRIARSLRVLEVFPESGRALEGRWAGTRFVLGPWPWMIVVCSYDATSERVYVVAVEDARSADPASAATT